MVKVYWIIVNVIFILEKWMENKVNIRIEKDSMGELYVFEDVFYGV